MTPKKKTSNSTTLKMERKRIINSSNGGDAKVHVAGGTQFNYQIEVLCFILNSSDMINPLNRLKPNTKN